MPTFKTIGTVSVIALETDNPIESLDVADDPEVLIFARGRGPVIEAAIPVAPTAGRHRAVPVRKRHSRTESAQWRHGTRAKAATCPRRHSVLRRSDQGEAEQSSAPEVAPD